MTRKEIGWPTTTDAGVHDVITVLVVRVLMTIGAPDVVLPSLSVCLR